MRLPRFVCVLLLSPTLLVPALADDPAPPTLTAEQQACLTWLSLAARFADDDEQRVAFDQEYRQLNRVLSPGTDVVADASVTEIGGATETYNQWVMAEDLADDATKAKMLNDLIDRATACEASVHVAAGGNPAGS